MKKTPALYSLLAVLCLAACPVDTDDTPETTGNAETPAAPAKTGKITFFNESSYAVIVHQDAFSGPVLLELSAGQSKRVDARVSDNYGVGSTFPIEYRYRVADGTDLASGEVWANGIDPNIQINQVVEENKSYTLQIPQPRELVFPQAFVKILNTSDMQFILHYLGSEFKQTGNGNLPVPVGKTGVYAFSASAEGKTINGYEVSSTFRQTPVPDFTAKNSYIYNFTYNGTSVVKNSEQKIVF